MAAYSRVKDECIIALKVYDQCRQQDCLTPEMLERPFSMECQTITTESGQVIATGKGSPINVPSGATDIVVKDFKLYKIETDRKQDAFRPKYYNVHVKYIFKFKLAFLNSEGCPIILRYDTVEREFIEAGTTFKKAVLLFGSEGSEITIASNLFQPESHVLEEAPYVLVESKAVLLDSNLNGCVNSLGCDCIEGALNDINLTIGLFSIIKLFRLVNLLVESKGFCKPNECAEVSPLNPCDVFESMDFPFEIFNPPQKEDLGCVDDVPVRKACDEDEE